MEERFSGLKALLHPDAEGVPESKRTRKFKTGARKRTKHERGRLRVVQTVNR